MKNTKSTSGKMLLSAIIALAVSSESFAQSNNAVWQGIGTDTVFTGRVVKIGPKSLVIDGSSSLTAPANQINSTVGLISFGNSNPLFYSTIRHGIGITNPLHKLHIHHFNILPFNQPSQPVNMAFTNLTTGAAAATDGFQIGILGNGTAEINQQENRDMLFSTGAGASNAIRMVILGLAGPAQGFVGIGTNFIAPNHLLDVRGGDINTGNGTAASPQGYRIGDQYVLRHNGGVTNILVGVGAGNVMPLNSTLQCTFVGNNSGFNNVGFANTFMGFESGFTNDLGDLNTFVGWRSGRASVTATAAGNSFFGGNSGVNNNFGNNNTFIGGSTGNSNIDGDNITLLGRGADVCATCPTLTNAVAIGSGAIVTSNFSIILGVNRARVGIGLSGNATPPNNNLEINATDPLTGNALVDKSGLTFRQLTSASSTSPSNGLVLTVDPFGEVILTTDQLGGGGQFFQCSVTPNLLPFDSWFQLNQKNFLFEGNGQGSAVNNVGIGLLGANTCLPLAKLHVQQSSGSAGSIGVKILNTDGDAAGLVVNTGNSPYSLIVPPGGYEGTQLSHQMYLGSDVTSLGITGTNMIGATLLYLGNSGDGTNAVCLGGGGWLNTSDASLKTNINTISGSLESIRKIRGVSFDWIGTNRHDFGFIAQEIDTVLPFLIKYDSAHSVRVMDMSKITPLTVEAIKQLDSAVTVLQNNPAQITADNGLTVTPSTNNVQLGGTLNQNTAINLNNTDLIFSDPAIPTLYTNKVSIGSPLPWSKFSVNNVTDGGAGYFATSTLNPTGWNVGVTATAENGSPNLGGRFVANNGAYNLGLTAEATNGSYANFGIRASASSTFAGAVNHAGYFDGDVAYTGTLYQASDSILKENIAPINDAINIISQLEPETFYFKTSQYPYLNLPAGKRFGLTAQQVETVLPEMVTINMHPEEKDLNGNTISPELIYKGVNYTDLIPILIQGMKEQQNQITALQTIIATCCSTNAKTTSSLPSTDAELASAGALLYQNIPNPFGDGTVIRYFVPENSNAVMQFFNEFGSEIKTVELPHKGITAELNLSTVNLASGIYSYSLVVNGKIADTKKMLKTK